MAIKDQLIFSKDHLIYVLCVLFVSCAHSPNYPTHWWAPIDSGKKSWEIAPDSVEPPKVILSKRNELGLLSNFAATPFQLDGKSYASMEGFWQAMKYPEGRKDPRWKMAKWPHTRAQVEQMVGHQAKRAGSFASKVMKKRKVRWVTYKGKKIIYREMGESEFYKIIQRAMQAKLEQNNKVKEVLVATGDLQLLPDHKSPENSPRAWKYYEIWMSFRSELNGIQQ